LKLNSHIDREGFPKKRFSTRKGAKANIKKLKRRFGDVMEEYKCPECNGFHVGHNRTKKPTKLNKKK